MHAACSATTDGSGVGFPTETRAFLFTTASRPIVWSTQWVSGFVFPGVKQPGRDVVHLPPSSAKDKSA
jgi:hypothetical protein